jgi:hypothetical protein
MSDGIRHLLRGVLPAIAWRDARLAERDAQIGEFKERIDGLKRAMAVAWQVKTGTALPQGSGRPNGLPATHRSTAASRGKT